MNELREELAEHLRECWPFVLCDGFQQQVADEAIQFLTDRLAGS